MKGGGSMVWHDAVTIQQKMTADEIRAYFMSKPGTWEDVPFNIPVPVFKVGDKMYGLININEKDRLSVNLKYHKDRIEELRAIHKDIHPGYHMNKSHWNTVYLDGELDDAFIKSLVDVSYDLVFKSLTKKKREEILG